MKRFLLILLCLLLVVGMTACGEEEQKPVNDEPEEQGPAAYAVDAVINRFFVEFIEEYEGLYLDIQSIRRAPGTSDTKTEDLTKEYLATINGCSVTLRNATVEKENDLGNTITLHQLRIVIEGGTTTQSRDVMMNAFLMMAPVADPSCSDAVAERAADTMRSMTQTGSLQVSDYLKVEMYTPVVEEYGVPCKIEMIALNYVPLEEE